MIKILLWIIGLIAFVFGELFLMIGFFGAYVLVPEMIAKGLLLTVFGIMCVIKAFERK